MTEKWEKLSLGWILVRKWLVITGQREFILKLSQNGRHSAPFQELCLTRNNLTKRNTLSILLHSTCANRYKSHTCHKNMRHWYFKTPKGSLWVQRNCVATESVLCSEITRWSVTLAEEETQCEPNKKHHSSGSALHIAIGKQMPRSWPTRWHTWSCCTVSQKGTCFSVLSKTNI